MVLEFGQRIIEGVASLIPGTRSNRNRMYVEERQIRQKERMEALGPEGALLDSYLRTQQVKDMLEKSRRQRPTDTP